jgi:sulfatase modifying factor 1
MKASVYIAGVFLVLVMYGCQQRNVPPTNSEPAAAQNVSAKSATPATNEQPSPDMILLQGGAFIMGAEDGFSFEGPAHEVQVQPFLIDKYEVTVARFAEFINATGYRTDAEQFGWSEVFDVKSGSWERVDGANWQHPDGPESIANPQEPVSQVSWNDAGAYAAWAKKRLPTEAEWEYAARGGLAGNQFAWGQELHPHGKHLANTWQGTFPERDTGEDGYKGRALVGRFPANSYGLFDITGNVWEWTADWFDEAYYRHSPRVNPSGPAVGVERAIRGGSWLCSANYCQGYRVAARSHATPDSGMNNLGFRCVRDAAGSEPKN